ncbi:MAG: hypothetical protein UE295_07250 [Acutalibacteraceae bacterium]|nr:hypothetical protein [Acutalibacteraceae bacterium]
MAGEAFISADISKITKFMTDSEDVITEFNEIKEKFNTINQTLLSKWKGEGADAYKTETDHILENIGGVKDALDGINNSAVKSIKDEYTKLDQQLAEFNKNPQSGEGSGG